MKATGSVRHIDNLGRIVLPIDVRRRLDLDTDDSVEIFTEKDRIILRKYEPGCIFCGDAEDVVLFRDKRVCRGCLEMIKEGISE